MTSCRVVRRKYADLNGDGARRHGGRFNPPGIPAVYSSESIALALLEVLVHLDKAEIPNDYVAMAINFAPGEYISAAERRARSAKPTGSSEVRGDLLPPADIAGAFGHRSSRIQLCSVPGAPGFRASIDWIEPLDFDSRLFASVGK